MSLGVIGGADGPTAIFVANPAGSIWLIAGVIAAVAAIAGVLCLFIAKKRK